MATVTKPETELFTTETITLDDICILADYVHSSERNKIDFAEKTNEELSKTGKKNYAALGAALAILERHGEAIKTLEKADDTEVKFLETAYSYRKLGDFDKALEALDKAAAKGVKPLLINLEKANVYRLKADFASADEQLKACANYQKVSVQYHYTLARCRQGQGLYSEAIENYEAAIEIDPAFSKALFHLAFLMDLRGDEEAAMDYYKQLTNNGPVYVSALLNMAVLYEDNEEYDKAAKCVKQVLKFHPNNARAILFEKDIDSSRTMLYDEDFEKSKDQHTKILETPVSDFELSVRSRNCLKKMNLNTIGDLLKITEPELLTYKNFGETSLNEIKHVLNAKNLRLGMEVEENTLDTLISTDSELDINQELLNKAIDDFELSIRAKKCLEHLNMKTIGELAAKTEAELLGVKNFGVTSLLEINQILESVGLSLRTLE